MIEAQAIKPHPVSSGVAQQGVDVNIGFYLPAMMKVCRAAFGAQSQVSEVGSSAETGAKAVEVQWTIQVANTEIDVREGGESWEKVRVEADERCAMPSSAKWRRVIGVFVVARRAIAGPKRL